MGRNGTPGPKRAFCLSLDQSHVKGFLLLFSLRLQRCDISSLACNSSARFTKINGRSGLELEGIKGGKAYMSFDFP